MQTYFRTTATVLRVHAHILMDFAKTGKTETAAVRPTTTAQALGRALTKYFADAHNINFHFFYCFHFPRVIAVPTRQVCELRVWVNPTDIITTMTPVAQKTDKPPKKGSLVCETHLGE